jgi:S1-C subfamily serine protease
VGDIIVAVGDRAVVKVDDLFDALDRATAGQQLQLTILRGQDRLVVPVRLAGPR